MKKVRVRFAPSPTGPLHIGGARSALFNWLYARHHGGEFIVRIEDTDLERSSRQSEEEILLSLRWLGMDWDEGIQIGGDQGPYRQTERLEIYKEYAQRLLDTGHAYYCYCTEEELAASREKFMAQGELPRYDGRCRHLDEEDRKKLQAEGRKPVVRFAVPAGQTIVVDDLVRGRVEFDCEGIGDYIVVKSDGVPTYNFAVAIDDHLMDITHVIRAEEHLSNTPRQLLIYEALDWETPYFAHISLIMGKDRAKMSKRHGATSLEQYRKLGYLPEALVNFLALLGWSPGGEEELLDIAEITSQFSLQKVSKSPAVFDLDKLNWINGQYIRQAPIERVVELALPYLQAGGYVPAGVTGQEDVQIRAMVSVVRNYLNNLSEITEHVEIFFKDPVYDEDGIEDILKGEQVRAVLDLARQKIEGLGSLDEEGIKAMIKKMPKELGFGGKKVFMPLRAALTGRKQGPELYQVIPALGLEKTIGRLEKAIAVAVSE